MNQGGGAEKSATPSSCTVLIWPNFTVYFYEKQFELMLLFPCLNCMLTTSKIGSDYAGQN